MGTHMAVNVELVVAFAAEKVRLVHTGMDDGGRAVENVVGAGQGVVNEGNAERAAEKD